MLLLFLPLIFGGCKTGFDKYWDEGSPKGGYLYNKIKNDPNFSTFAAGLERAGLSQYIDKGGLYTVFAPTNDAFAKYLSSKGVNSINDIPIDSLFGILSFHIVNNMWYYYDLKARYNGPYKQVLYLTRNKKFVNIDVKADNAIKINDVPVINELRDIDADNGVIHGIAEVLAPLPNLEEVMKADPELANSTFYKLMQRAADRQYDRFNSFDRDRDGRIDSVFYKVYPLLGGVNMSIEFKQNQNTDNQGGDPVFTTLLVPANEVFDPYLAPVLAKFGGKIDSLSPSYAEEVLENYFIADTAITAASIMARATAPALRTINNEPLLTTALKTPGDFRRRDIRASNGVIHIINSVMPASDRQKSALGLAMTDPDLTMFMAALQTAGLMNTYAASTKTATFLIPTNTAFKEAGVDTKNRIVNGAQLTATQFSDWMKLHIIAENLTKAGLTGTKNSEVGASQQLVFSNSGTTVTSPGGTVATISHPEVSKGPSNIGFVYKIDKLLQLK